VLAIQDTSEIDYQAKAGRKQGNYPRALSVAEISESMRSWIAPSCSVSRRRS
jgi:hypothetical protein